MNDEFRHRTRIEVQFRDIDAFGHVNNAVTASYVEQARVRYLADVVGIEALGPAGMPLILAHLEIDYADPIFWADLVVVDSRVDWIGRTSLAMRHRLSAEADGRELATAASVLVAYDYGRPGPMPVPDAWRSALVAHEGHPLERPVLVA